MRCGGRGSGEVIEADPNSGRRQGLFARAALPDVPPCPGRGLRVEWGGRATRARCVRRNVGLHWREAVVAGAALQRSIPFAIIVALFGTVLFSPSVAGAQQKSLNLEQQVQLVRLAERTNLRSNGLDQPFTLDGAVALDSAGRFKMFEALGTALGAGTGSAVLANITIDTWTGDLWGDDCKEIAFETVRKLQNSLRSKLGLSRANYIALRERRGAPPLCK